MRPSSEVGSVLSEGKFVYLSTYLKKPSMSLSPLSVWTASDICLIGEQGLGRRARGRRPPPPRPRPRESNDVAAAAEKVGR